MGSESATDEIFSQPTAVIVKNPMVGELDTVREIEPPEKHLGSITVGRQVETVLEDMRADTGEHELSTTPSANLLQRVRTEMRKRRVQSHMLARYVERPF